MVELLISLAISAMLLTATMVATDACFKAYADATEQFSTHAATRMVTHRLLTLIRTNTAHGPLKSIAAHQVSIKDPSDITKVYTADIAAASISGNNITSPYIEMIDTKGVHLKIAYLSYKDSNNITRKELWLFSKPGTANEVSQPLLDSVNDCVFTSVRRKNSKGVWVLQRATMDLTVQPGQDNTLTIENGTVVPVRFYASTKPRKLDL
ncbi:MAG: hypothetical protein HC898_01780 [Phycisphaerales bacterium]|nr:hypothetical protein [Phycisphaerales bacterium]